MFAVYKIMLPLLLVMFVAMGLWVSVLHFPWEWVFYMVMGLEVMVATVAMTMEYQAQQVGGVSSWGSLGLIGSNLFLLVCWVYYVMDYGVIKKSKFRDFKWRRDLLK